MIRRIFFHIIASIGFLCSCDRVPGLSEKEDNCTYTTTLVAGTPSHPVSKNEIQKVIDLLSNRFRKVDKKFTITGEKEKIHLSIDGVAEDELPRMRMLSTVNVDLGFWETYSNEETISFLIRADSVIAAGKVSAGDTTAATRDIASLSLTEQLDVKKDEAVNVNDGEHPLLSVLSLSVNTTSEGVELIPGPVVGYANESDTAQVMAYIKEAQSKKVFPEDMVFMWDAKLNYFTSVIELYAVRAHRGGALLSGDIIKEAEIVIEPEHGGYASISLGFNRDAAQKWSRITANNIGKSIVIVFDKRVFSAPTVQNEITGGLCTISGDFSIREAEDLVNVLRVYNYPFPVSKITETLRCK